MHRSTDSRQNDDRTAVVNPSAEAIINRDEQSKCQAVFVSDARRSSSIAVSVFRKKEKGIAQIKSTVTDFVNKIGMDRLIFM